MGHGGLVVLQGFRNLARMILVGMAGFDRFAESSLRGGGERSSAQRRADGGGVGEGECLRALPPGGDEQRTGDVVQRVVRARERAEDDLAVLDEGEGDGV